MSELIIVDPQFKEQFMIPGSSLQYSQLIDILPSIFVGKAIHLDSIVRCMCTEVRLSNILIDSIRSRYLPIQCRTLNSVNYVCTHALSWLPGSQLESDSMLQSFTFE